jgi:hypothetical protein
MKMKTCRCCGVELKDDNYIPEKNLCRDCDAVSSGSRHAMKRIIDKLGKTSPVNATNLRKHAEKRICIAIGFPDQEVILEELMELAKGRVSKKDSFWIFVYCMTNTKDGRSRMGCNDWKYFHHVYRMLTGKPRCGVRQRKNYVPNDVFFPKLERCTRSGKGGTGTGLRVPDPGP